jgi:hypothetical protein
MSASEPLVMAEGGGTAYLHVATSDGGWRHTHTHSWMDGTRSFTHAHDYPQSANDPNATRPHRHVNGHHSHPHGHEAYR